MAGNIDDDDHIAALLKQDALNAKKQYELVGIDAFNPKRSRSGAPKPNKSFLRHIIQQTSSHNSALLAKEAAESNTRLQRMNEQRIRAQNRDAVLKAKKADGRLTPVLSDEEDSCRMTSRRRTADGERSDRRGRSHRHRQHSSDARDWRYRSRSRNRSRDGGRSKRKRDHSEHSCSRRARHSDSHRDTHHRRRAHSKSDGEADGSYRKHRSRHRHKHHGSRRRSSSRSPHGHDDDGSKYRKVAPSSRQRSPDAGFDSDPLEAIVGPLPPTMAPCVSSRGRGAHKAQSMAMDARFSSAYDPSTDLRPPSDAEDDWGDALESFRDRQRFNQQGADRLRAAGFTDEQVSKWETGHVKDEADVTWTKRGQAREWDRGKVVDEDGDVALKADWGHLK
ncbi:hypothetical protein ACEQ8H_003759 [Pleosporales sp. CAS-2024a]